MSLFDRTLLSFLSPATKLEQGYIFTGVCDSVHRGEGASSRGVPGDCLVEIPPGRLLLRAVRILLECILVDFSMLVLFYILSKYFTSTRDIHTDLGRDVLFGSECPSQRRQCRNDDHA